MGDFFFQFLFIFIRNSAFFEFLPVFFRFRILRNLVAEAVVDALYFLPEVVIALLLFHTAPHFPVYFRLQTADLYFFIKKPANKNKSFHNVVFFQNSLPSCRADRHLCRNEISGVSRRVGSFQLLHLLIRAWTRREQLPDDLRATVRSHVGITVRAEDVLASPGVSDTWVVVAGRDSVEGRLAERRLWLYGTTTRRWALILAFAPISGGFSTTVVPGTRFDAVAHFYPGRGQLRVALSDEQPSRPVAGWVPEPLGTASARECWRRAVAADPWVEAVPVLVSGRFRLLGNGEPALGDADGALPLITPDDARWVLPLLTDGDEVTVTGELSPAGLRALSVVTDGEVRAL